MMTNSVVKTPIGEGVCQGRFAVMDGNNQPVENAVLVRIELTDENRHIVGRSNCITPNAKYSAVFVFPESDLA